MKAKVIFLLMGCCALAAPAAEPTAEQVKEGVACGERSQVDLLKAQEGALLKEIIGNRELPEIQVEGDNTLAACLQVLVAQGEISQQDVQKAQDEWMRVLQTGVVLRGLPADEKSAALKKNLEEQLKFAQELKAAGVGNTLELFMVKAKLSAWFK